MTAAVVALAVLEILGPGVLRRAWINVDRIWAVALTGAATVRTTADRPYRPSPVHQSPG